MRILQIVHGFPPESIAGTEAYVATLSRYLLARGHVCTVLAGSKQCAPEAMLGTEEQDGLLVTRYLRPAGQPRQWTEEYDAEAEALTRHLLDLVKPSVVHLHHWQWLTNNLVAICTDLGVPVIVTLHDVWTTCPRIHRIRSDGAFCIDPPATAPCLSCVERQGPWQGDQEIASMLTLRRGVVEAELALAAAIIAPSEAHRALLIKLLHLPPERVMVLPLASTSTIVAMQRRGERTGFPNRPLQIGHWGYLVYPKGTHLILEAVHKLRNPSATQIHLIGTTIEKGYEQRLRELACGISVEFHGAYLPADLQAFDLDIAVFPSIASESYSFALDEALRLGLPVLASDRGAFPERIGMAGLTFRAGDAGHLAQQLQELLDTPDLLGTMRRSIRPDTLLPMEAHVAMLEKIYEDAAHVSTSKGGAPAPSLKLIAQVKKQLREREAVLVELQHRLAQAEQVIHDKEALLREVRQNLDTLQADHAQMSTYLLNLKRTPLFMIQEFLEKLSGLPDYLLSKGRRKIFSRESLSLQKWRVWLRRSSYLGALGYLLSKGRRKIFSRESLSLQKWRVWLRRFSEEYARVRVWHREWTGVRAAGPLTAYDVHVQTNQITPWLGNVLSCAAREFAYQPKISILMPVYNVQLKWLKIAVDSIKSQIYPYWELCIADDGSTLPELAEYLRSLERDGRIKVVFRSSNGHVCAASNSAAELATGEFIVLMDNDDVLAPTALFEIARFLQNHPDADLIYSDEDKIDESGHRYNPQFKPDWSPELLLAYNYINHLTCIRRELFERVGRFRIGYEGAQDYDLILRATCQTDRVHHIPKVLYHWRALQSSTALDAAVKPFVHTSSRAALEDYLNGAGIAANLYVPDFARRLRLPINQLDWPDAGPSVEIIIATCNQGTLLKKCVESIFAKTTYANYGILVVANESSDAETLEYLKALRDKGVRVERISNQGRPFSFSRINNLAVQHAEKELVLFLNDDTEVVEPKWLSRMVGYLSLPGVGATGARLLFGNGTIQHAGVVMGLQNGIAPGHAFLDHPASEISYYFQAEIARPCVAVTGACLLTPRELFLELGGFDEKHYAVSLNDVDYCLRLAQRGLRTVYVGGAELLHHGGQTRYMKQDNPAELAHFRRIHGQARDIYYNPNLSNVCSYRIDTGCHLDYEAFLDRPVRALMATHNLNLEGAPKFIYELAAGLKKRGRIQPTILSPVGGIGEEWYREAEIDVQIQELPNCRNVLEGWSSKADYQASVERVLRIIEKERPDVVVANVLNSFYVVDAARRAGIPSIWIIHESYSQELMLRSINAFAWPFCERAFTDAYRVVFVSTDTMRLYERYNTHHNFLVVHNGLDSRRIEEFVGQIDKTEAVRSIQAPAGKKIITTVGTICERKAQHTLAQAAAILRKERDDFCCYMVGLRQSDIYYSEKVKRIIRENHLEDFVKLVPEIDEVHPYYRAADIFAFTSHIEAFSRTILEAEAFGLPIVTTLCCGIAEQVRGEVNALLFNMDDAPSLARHIATLLDDDQKRLRMGWNSRKIFEYLQTYDEMLERYERLVFGAWMRGPSES